MNRWSLERYRWQLWIAIVAIVAIVIAGLTIRSQHIAKTDALQLTIAQGTGQSHFYLSTEAASASAATAIDRVAAQMAETKLMPGAVGYSIFVPPALAQSAQKNWSHAYVKATLARHLAAETQWHSTKPLVPYFTTDPIVHSIPWSIIQPLWRHPAIKLVTWDHHLFTFAPIIWNGHVEGLTLVDQSPHEFAAPIITHLVTTQLIAEISGAIGLAILLYFLIGLWLVRPIRYQNEHDGMTQLTNQDTFWKLFPTYYDLAHTQKKPLSLMVMDLDLFKKVNDTYGHSTGDDVLKAFAQVVRQYTRSNDLVARIGGEEFAVVCSGCTIIKAQAIAETIRKSWEHTHPHDIAVTCSIGIAEITGTTTPKKLFQVADAALYQAKNNGRNQVSVDSRAIS